MKKSLIYALYLGLQLGLIIALPLVILALGGRLLDRHLNTSPLFLLLGIFLSLISSTLAIYRYVKIINRDKD